MESKKKLKTEDKMKHSKLKEQAEKIKPNKLKSSDKPTIEEQFDKDNKAKADAINTIKAEIKKEEQKEDKLDMFIENRNMYVVLTKDSYKKFVLAEIKEYGQKMPFGKASRPIGTEHIFYYSDKLKKLLDDNKIYYSLLETKEELIDFLQKVK